MSIEKEFVWNDELVKEFMDKYNNISGWITGIDPRGDKMKEFKQSKLSNDKGSERVEVSDIMEANTNVGRRTYAGYAFTSSKLIPPDKFPLIKLLIERFLNDEYRIHIGGTWSIHSHGERTFIQSEVDTIREDLWNRCREWADGQWSNQFFPDGKNSQFKYPTLQDYLQSLPESKIKEQGTDTKDWGIVSVEDGVANGSQGKGKIVYIQKGDESSWIKANIKINSVKRLSDGVVFSIGDYVGITKESGKSIKGWKDIIESFLIVDDTMVSVFKTFRQPINDLNKLTPTEETDKAVEKQCQGIYNQAIDHAIGIINARLGDDLPIPNPLVTEIINSLTNLKR